MSSGPYEYDVCLSFASEQREYVEAVASRLRRRGIRTFYDNYEAGRLWGKDLYEHLDEVYSRSAAYCVMFISADYARKLWTNHERRSAQARAFVANREYILPARFDDTQIPGLRPTIGYIDLTVVSQEMLVELIVKKVQEDRSRESDGARIAGPTRPSPVNGPPFHGSFAPKTPRRYGRRLIERCLRSGRLLRLFAKKARVSDLHRPAAVLLGIGSLTWIAAQYLPWRFSGYGSLVELGPFITQNVTYWIVLGQTVALGAATKETTRATIGAFMVGGSGWIIAWPAVVLTRLGERSGQATVEAAFVVSAVTLFAGSVLACVALVRQVGWTGRRDLGAVLAAGSALASAALIAGYDAQRWSARYLPCFAVTVIAVGVAAQGNERRVGMAALCGWIGYGVLDRVGWLLTLWLAGEWGEIHYERFAFYAGGLFDEGNVDDFTLEWIGPLLISLGVTGVMLVRLFLRSARMPQDERESVRPGLRLLPVLLLCGSGGWMTAQILPDILRGYGGIIETGPFLAGNLSMLVLAGVACALLVTERRESTSLLALISGGAGWLLIYPVLTSVHSIRSGEGRPVIFVRLVATVALAVGVGMALTHVHRILGRPVRASLAAMGAAAACALGLYSALNQQFTLGFFELTCIVAATASVALAVASARRRAAVPMLVGWVGFAVAEYLGTYLARLLTDPDRSGYDYSLPVRSYHTLVAGILLAILVSAWLQWGPSRSVPASRAEVD
jgi:hypothetical protein